MEIGKMDRFNINSDYLMTSWNTSCLVDMTGLLKLQVCIYSN